MKPVYYNPFKDQQYQLADGRWVEIGDLYHLAFWKCYRSKHRQEAEEFALWCVEYAVKKGNKLGKYAHLNKIAWLFSEWLFTFYGEGKPTHRGKKTDIKRAIANPISINGLEKILANKSEDEEKEESWDLKEKLLPVLRSVLKNPSDENLERLEDNISVIAVLETINENKSINQGVLQWINELSPRQLLKCKTHKPKPSRRSKTTAKRKSR